MKDMAGPLQDLFQGKISSSEEDQTRAREVWSCIDRALGVFSNFTQGKNPDYYEASELQEFANHFLSQGQTINDEFLASIFKLKTVVLGGSPDRLTRPEILKLRNNLNLFGEAIVPLSPYIGTLLKPQDKPKAVKLAAMDAMKTFSGKLAAIFATSVSPMPWDVVSDFARNLEQYTKAQEVTGLTTIHEQTDLLKHLKVLLIGGSEKEIEPAKWTLILNGFTATVGSLAVASSPEEMVRSFDLKFGSTPEEQASSIEGMGNSLKELLHKPDLKTIQRIRLIADYWIKGRLLIEVLVPKGNPGVSLDVFLEDVKLRDAENRFASKLLGMKSFKAEQSTLLTLVAEIRKLLSAADRAISNRLGRRASFSPEKIQGLSRTYLELFQDQEFGKSIIRMIPVFQSLHTAITGKDSRNIPLSDLDPVLDKAEQFLAETPAPGTPMETRIENWIRILRKPPSVEKIQRKAIDSLLPQLLPILNERFQSTLTLEQLKPALDLVFSLKSSLWNSDPETLSLLDVEKVLFVWKIRAQAQESPDEFLASLQREFQTPQFSPSIPVSAFEKLSASLASIQSGNPDLKKIQAGLEMAPVLIQFMTGLNGPEIPLLPVSDAMKSLKKMRDISTGKGDGAEKAREILKAILQWNGPLLLSQKEIEMLIENGSVMSGKDYRSYKPLIPEILLLKHQLFGTRPDSLERLDFLLLLALLDTKGDPLQRLNRFLSLLEKNGNLQNAVLDLVAVRDALSHLQSANPEIGAKLEPTLGILNSVLAPDTGIFNDSHPKVALKDLKDAVAAHLKAQNQSKAQDILVWLNLASKLGLRDPLPEASLSALIERLRADSPGEAKKDVKILSLGLDLKALIFGSSPDSLSSAEITSVENLLKIVSSGKTKEAKGKLLAAWVKKNIRRKIHLTPFANKLQALLHALNLESKLPLPLTPASLKRLKLLTVGGDLETITPDELSKLAEKAISAESAGEVIEAPKFALDASSFFWLENAVALAIDAKKELGLKTAYAAISDYFEKSGHPMKRPMERSLYGIWYHAIDGRKGPLPVAVAMPGFALTDDDKITTAHLKDFYSLLKRMRTRLKDLEDAYHGSGTSVQPLLKVILKSRLKMPENLALVDTFSPVIAVINGIPTLKLSSTYAYAGSFEFVELAYKIVMDEAVTHLFRRYNSYGTGPSLRSADFTHLLEDLRIPMINFGLLYKSGDPAVTAPKQMNSINLFTRTGNGNSLLEVNETVEFMTLSYGMGATFKRLIGYLSNHCRKTEVDGLDAYDGYCVTQSLFQSSLYSTLYKDSLPEMTAAYSALNYGQRTQFELGTLKLTGKNLLKEKKRGLFDAFDDRTIKDYDYVNFDLDMLQSINSVHPMIESVFESMDANRDQRIQLNEALAQFDKFCPTLKTAAKGKVSGDCSSPEKSKDLKALFGYLLVHKEKPGIGFYFWDDDWEEYQNGKQKFNPLTRFDIFRIVSNLAP